MEVATLEVDINNIYYYNNDKEYVYKNPQHVL